MKFTNFKNAFTLIELLVVIAIIALLVSILMPSLTKARLLAQRVVCQSNLNGIGLGMALYKDDYTVIPCFMVWAKDYFEQKSTVCPSDPEDGQHFFYGTSRIQMVYDPNEPAIGTSYYSLPADYAWWRTPSIGEAICKELAGVTVSNAELGMRVSYSDIWENLTLLRCMNRHDENEQHAFHLRAGGAVTNYYPADYDATPLYDPSSQWNWPHWYTNGER